MKNSKCVRVMSLALAAFLATGSLFGSISLAEEATEAETVTVTESEKSTASNNEKADTSSGEETAQVKKDEVYYVSSDSDNGTSYAVVDEKDSSGHPSGAEKVYEDSMTDADGTHTYTTYGVDSTNVEFTGTAKGDSNGPAAVYAAGEDTVITVGDVESVSGYAVYAESSATVNVKTDKKTGADGDITVEATDDSSLSNAYGISSTGAEVNVDGDVTVKGTEELLSYAEGVYAGNTSKVDVKGSVEVAIEEEEKDKEDGNPYNLPIAIEKFTGFQSSDTVPETYGVYAENGSSVEVGEDVSVSSTGVAGGVGSYGIGSSVDVGGDVKVSAGEEAVNNTWNSYGVYAGMASSVTVGGDVEAEVASNKNASYAVSNGSSYVEIGGDVNYTAYAGTAIADYTDQNLVLPKVKYWTENVGEDNLDVLSGEDWDSTGAGLTLGDSETVVFGVVTVVDLQAEDADNPDADHNLTLGDSETVVFGDVTVVDLQAEDADNPDADHNLTSAISFWSNDADNTVIVYGTVSGGDYAIVADEDALGADSGNTLFVGELTEGSNGWVGVDPGTGNGGLYDYTNIMGELEANGVTDAEKYKYDPDTGVTTWYDKYDDNGEPLEDATVLYTCNGDFADYGCYSAEEVPAVSLSRGEFALSEAAMIPSHASRNAAAATTAEDSFMLNNVNYIIRGAELADSIMNGDSEAAVYETSKGYEFTYAKEGDELTIALGKNLKVKKSNYSEVINNHDGTYTVIVCRGGDITIIKVTPKKEETKKSSIRLIANADHSFSVKGGKENNFIEVLLDGEKVESEFYTLTTDENGNLTVVFTDAYLALLAAGEYPVRIRFTNGNVNGTLSI